MSALAAPRAWVMSEMARDDPKPLWRSRRILCPPRSSSILGPSSRRCCTSCARRRWCPSHTHTGLAARPAPTSSLLVSAPQPPSHTLHAAHSHRTPTLYTAPYPRAASGATTPCTARHRDAEVWRRAPHGHRRARYHGSPEAGRATDGGGGERDARSRGQARGAAQALLLHERLGSRAWGCRRLPVLVAHRDESVGGGVQGTQSLESSRTWSVHS